MSLPGLVTIKDQAVQLKTHLDTALALPESMEAWGKCEVKVMRHLGQLWRLVQDMAKTGHGKVVLICFNGERSQSGGPAGNRTYSHRVTRSWLVVCVGEHDLEAGQGLAPEKEGKPSFYDFVELIRDGCRVIDMSEDLLADYETIRPLAAPYPGIPHEFLNAYAIEFTTDNDLQKVEPETT